VDGVDTTRLVLIDATVLDDVLDLASRVTTQLDSVEADALRGAVAEARVRAIPEP
jgi:hypothetical protein